MSREDFLEWLSTCPAKFEVRDEHECIEVWFSGIDEESDDEQETIY